MDKYLPEFINSFQEDLLGTCYRCEINTEWTMLYISAHIRGLSGYPASDFINDQVRSYDSIIHSDDRQHVASVVLDGVEKNSPYTIQYRIVTAEGKTKWVLERGRSTYSSDGRRVLDGFIIDITERMELEEARRIAETENRAKSLFLAHISHEIRTPLNGIVGMTSLLRQQDNLEESSKKLVDTIWSSSEVLRHLINDVLDFSKIEAGKFEIRLQPFRLKDEFASVIEAMKPLALEKNIALVSHLDPQLPDTVLGDAVRLKQVLLNLISNAIKFTQEGKVSVKLQRTNGDLCFSVQDTGIGIPAELQGQLFRPFSQLENSKQQHHGSTGLGLAISKQLAELMNGTLALTESTPHQGSTFAFTIPVEEPSKGERPPLQDNGKLPGLPDSFDLSILVVDDIPVNLNVAQAMISRFNSRQITLANNGKEALNIFQKEPTFDLILMDMQMPEMDGAEATRAIRSHHEGLRPYIVAMTGNMMEDRQERRAQTGLDSFLSKPFTLSEMQSILGEASTYRAQGQLAKS